METTLKFRRLKWAGSVIRMQDDRLPKVMMFGEMEGGQRSRGNQGVHWRNCLLIDLIDFGMLERKDKGKKWDDQRAKAWKDEIAVLAADPEGWNRSLIEGRVHFIENWHEKEEMKSKVRREAREAQRIRLRVILFNGWRQRPDPNVVLDLARPFPEGEVLYHSSKGVLLLEKFEESFVEVRYDLVKRVRAKEKDAAKKQRKAKKKSEEEAAKEGSVLPDWAVFAFLQQEETAEE
jgi:hypothetical protein